MSRQVYTRSTERGSAAVLLLAVVMSGALVALSFTVLPSLHSPAALDGGSGQEAWLVQQDPKSQDPPTAGGDAGSQSGEGQAAGLFPGEGTDDPITRFQLESCSECDATFVNEGQTNAITTTMLQDRSVGPIKAMLNVFGSGHIQNYSIASWDMMDNTVGSRVLGGDAVSSAHIADGSITSDDISTTYSNSFLRSDTSDSFTSGTLTFDAGTTLSMSGVMELYNGSSTQTADFDGATASGALLTMYNDGGVETVYLDSDNGDAGWMVLTNGTSSATKIELDGDGLGDDGGEIDLNAADGSGTIHLDAQETDDAGAIEVRNSTSGTRVLIDGMDFGGGRIDIRDSGSSNAIVLRAEEMSSMDNGAVFEMFAEDGAEVVEIDSGFASDSGVRFWIDGDYVAEGTKTAAVTVDSGEKRLMYCTEATELWFEDVGSGQLDNGVAELVLDPLYLQTVTINEDHPMRVLITLTDDCNGVFVKKYADGFTVQELMGGTSNATFDYKVICKRRGHETARMELFVRNDDGDPDDPGNQSMNIPTEGLGDPSDGKATAVEE